MNLAHAIVQRNRGRLEWVEDIKDKWPKYFQREKERLETAPNRSTILKKGKKEKKVEEEQEEQKEQEGLNDPQLNDPQLNQMASPPVKSIKTKTKA